MNLLGKSLAVGAMALAATGAQATIKGGVNNQSTEMFFNLWNPVAEVSYALDLGVVHNDFFQYDRNTGVSTTQAMSWTIDASTSTAFAQFLSATQPGTDLFYNIASSNASTTGANFAAFENWGVLRTSNDANISKVTPTEVSAMVSNINFRIIDLNTKLNVSGGDTANNFDSFSVAQDASYFVNNWGDSMNNSTKFSSIGQEGEGNTLGFYWMNRELAQVNTTGIEYLGDWSFVIDYSAKTASLNFAPVPLPAAVWLFGTGLIGLLGAGRRKSAAA